MEKELIECDEAIMIIKTGRQKSIEEERKRKRRRRKGRNKGRKGEEVREEKGINEAMK